MNQQLTLAYPARLKRDANGRMTVTFRDLPHALTDGADEAEATREARDCLDEAIASLIDNAEPISAPSAPKRGERLVPVSPLIAGKAALSDAMAREGIKQSALAKRLGITQKAATQLLDPRYQTRIDGLMRALEAVGVNAAIAVLGAPLRPLTPAKFKKGRPAKVIAAE